MLSTACAKPPTLKAQLLRPRVSAYVQYGVLSSAAKQLLSGQGLISWQVGGGFFLQLPDAFRTFTFRAFTLGRKRQGGLVL